MRYKKGIAHYIDLSITKMYNKLELGLEIYSVEEIGLEFQYPDSSGMSMYMDECNNFYARTELK